MNLFKFVVVVVFLANVDTGYGEQDSPCNPTLGDFDYDSECCDDVKCRAGEGDCDSDSQCEGELECGTNNCGDAFPSSGADCCQAVVKEECNPVSYWFDSDKDCCTS